MFMGEATHHDRIVRLYFVVENVSMLTTRFLQVHPQKKSQIVLCTTEMYRRIYLEVGEFWFGILNHTEMCIERPGIV